MTVLPAVKEIFALIKSVGKSVAVPAEPSVNVVPAAIVSVPAALPTIWNPPSANVLFALIVRFPFIVVAAPSVFVTAAVADNVRFPYAGTPEIVCAASEL